MSVAQTPLGRGTCFYLEQPRVVLGSENAFESVPIKEGHDPVVTKALLDLRRLAQRDWLMVTPTNCERCGNIVGLAIGKVV